MKKRASSETELNFEDIVFNDEQKEEPDHLELPLSRQTFILVAVLVIAVGFIALSRVGFLNVVRGAFYQVRSLANVNREIDLPAPRGIIFDRYGKPLVENESSFSVFLSVGDLLKSGDYDQSIAEVSEILDIPADDLRAMIQKANLEKKNFILIARNISLEQVIHLKALNSPHVQIGDDYVRKYIDNFAFSHILGYVGISDYANAVSGKTGLEAQYDELLRGQDGKLIVYKDAAGNELERKVVEIPKIGNNLTATIDADLQKYFYDRLKSGLAALGRDSGVGIAINPQNGEVLALLSLPSFDSNKVAKYLQSPSQPLFNRAISGVYTPGSTIKPLVALAALKENIIDPKKQILSTGSIAIPNPYDPEKPSRFLDWKAHGWVDLHSALARSSNVYFYEIGGGFEGLKGLGINKLKEYWQRFLLGAKTGIDLPAENSGFLPDPEEKEERTGQIWRIGDTYNVSIGQGDLLLTPLQLINFIASIANGGKIYRPHLVLDPKPYTLNPRILLDYSQWQSEIKEVQKGMEDAVKKYYGTANLLSLLPMSAAGKTGSAQVANNTRTNAFFVGYAPAENPEIAILVLIENAREGSLNAVPIAKDVLEWYYYNRRSKNAQFPISNYQ